METLLFLLRSRGKTGVFNFGSNVLCVVYRTIKAVTISVSKLMVQVGI